MGKVHLIIRPKIVCKAVTMFKTNLKSICYILNHLIFLILVLLYNAHMQNLNVTSDVICFKDAYYWLFIIQNIFTTVFTIMFTISYLYT